jgi:hypothetical protein
MTPAKWHLILGRIVFWVPIVVMYVCWLTAPTEWRLTTVPFNP